MLPTGANPNSSAPVTLDSNGIPSRALEAYRQAAKLADAADPGCHIDWALVAAIGRVESNHARFGGNQLDNTGVAQPGVFGMALDGSNGTARIMDTDHGLLDRDTTYDRAVGPMQFIPSTWRIAGVDGNGDGVKDPQNIFDAATATAVYLCSGPGDLSHPADLRSAVMRYNNSDFYVKMVTSIAAAYRRGVPALPASDLTPGPTSSFDAVGAPTVSLPASRALTSTRTTTTPRKSVRGTTALGRTAPPATVSPTTVPPATVSPTTVPSATVPPATVPPATVPPATVPPATVPPATVPPTTVPPATVPPTTVPPATVPPTTVPLCPPAPTPASSAVPVPAEPCMPPCLLDPTTSPAQTPLLPCVPVPALPLAAKP